MTGTTWAYDCAAGRARAAAMLQAARIEGSDAMAAECFFHLRSRIADLTGEDTGFIAHLCEKALAGEIAISGGLLAHE